MQFYCMPSWGLSKYFQDQYSWVLCSLLLYAKLRAIKIFSGSIFLSFMQFVIVCRAEGYQNILKLSCGPFLIKIGQELVFLLHFLYNFWWKIFLLFSIDFYILSLVSLSACLYFVRHWAICINIWQFNLIFLIRPISLRDQKLMTKTWISWAEKELLMKQA